MRALSPREDGYATNPNDGVRIFYEVFGPADAERTILFLPTSLLVYRLVWKMQVPYFARIGFRVIVFDPRGRGNSEKPATGYGIARIAEDALAVLDAVSFDRAAIVGYSRGGNWAAYLAAEHSDRISQVVFIGVRGGNLAPLVARPPFFEENVRPEGWGKYNAHHWRRDYPDFVEWFIREVASEHHSTKQIEDLSGWFLEADAEILITALAEGAAADFPDLLQRIACPTLILQGGDDLVCGPENGPALQALVPGSRLVMLEGCGHSPQSRDPVKVNHLIHEFLGPTKAPVRTWRRAISRTRKRALFVSSPIGLGHVQRDLAIADALRSLEPTLEIDWLAQDPVNRVLEQRGERIHPISAQLAGEARHIESECGEHDLHAFQALRRMDEILLANFHVFHDAVRDSAYDLWVADEGWDIDYYLHENPELKTAPFVWLTDFVGFLPMRPEEAWLTADYNAEMIEQVARFPRIRDRALYVGNPADLVPDSFGPGLPAIREWTEAHYRFPGYIQYFDPDRYADRGELRAQLGFRDGEQVVFATVGGTAVGRSLLHRLIDAFPEIRRRTGELRLIVVAGPRIDPESLPRVEGLEVRGYVHNLYEHLAACDLALVQGGLSTTMELVATGRPFLYFPLRNHFEQNVFVPHRLANYGVSPEARVDYDRATPDFLAERIVRTLGRTPDYRPIETGGAERAARAIAELL